MSLDIPPETRTETTTLSVEGNLTARDLQDLLSKWHDLHGALEAGTVTVSQGLSGLCVTLTRVQVVEK